MPNANPALQVHEGEARNRLPFLCVPSMFDCLEVKVLFTAWWRRSDSEAQGRRREARSESSAEQTREPMNKNWIGGLRCRASEHMIAKPTSIQSTGGKSSGCAWKAIELTSGDLLHVTES
jgi:hypothetical protein